MSAIDADETFVSSLVTWMIILKTQKKTIPVAKEQFWKSHSLAHQAAATGKHEIVSYNLYVKVMLKNFWAVYPTYLILEFPTLQNATQPTAETMSCTNWQVYCYQHWTCACLLERQAFRG